jgi:hypothetical protein
MKFKDAEIMLLIKLLELILQGYNDSVLQFGLLSFCTLSII